jgi:hypothetical protein
MRCVQACIGQIWIMANVLDVPNHVPWRSMYEQSKTTEGRGLGQVRPAKQARLLQITAEAQ